MVLGLKRRAWGTGAELDLIIRDVLGRAEAERDVRPSLADADYGVRPGLDKQAHRPDCGCIWLSCRWFRPRI
ncbi:hypothetical protein CsSME_00027443 [Camellia sinensis var. sinensis]